MRVRGDNAPSNAFSMEEQPKHLGFVLVRFYENIVPFEEKEGELTISGYEYDEYHLELEYYDELGNDILNNFEALFEQAKALEVDNEPEQLEARVSVLEADKADKDEVQAVWDQMAAAYAEGVNIA